jgi:hypothetical protein
MASALLQRISSAELIPGKGSRIPPFAQQTVVLTKQAYIQLKWEARVIALQVLEKPRSCLR